MFDFGHLGRVRTEWTELGDALLVMDRDANGQIDGTELFGDVTVAEDGATAPNGWLALALYDARSRGGNADGVIDASDSAYEGLSVWVDANADARVNDGELRSLSAAGVAAIDIDGHAFVRSNGERGEAQDLTFAIHGVVD